MLNVSLKAALHRLHRSQNLLNLRSKFNHGSLSTIRLSARSYRNSGHIISSSVNKAIKCIDSLIQPRNVFPQLLLASPELLLTLPELCDLRSILFDSLRYRSQELFNSI